jgi:adenylylsulfate kinase
MTWAIWITGLPGSGKSVLAEKVGTIMQVQVLELDEIRKFITPKPSYSDDEREIVYASLVYMAKIMVASGIPVIIDATANRRRYRDSKKDGATVPGVNVPYEEPLNPDVVVDSERMGVKECAEKVVEYIVRQGWRAEENR